MRDRQYSYRLLNTGMLLGIVLTGAGRFLGVGALSTVHVLTAAAVLSSGVLLQRLTVRGRAVCALLTAVFLGAVAAALGVERSGLFIRSWFNWLAGQESWLDEWRVGYEVLQVALAALGCYGLQFVLERFLVVKVLTADLVVSWLLFGLLTEWEVSHTAVAFSLCYITVVYAEWVQREWDKVKSGDRKRYMLWIMPFMALYFVLLLCTPTPEKPYEWQFVKNTCSRIGTSLIGLTQHFMQGGGDDFDTALSGFSGEGTLQDKLQENDREIMTVQGTGSLVTNVYLTGRIYDTFDGKAWRQTYHGMTQEAGAKEAGGFQDALQTQEAARQYEAALLRDQIATATLRIRYRYFRTSCLFVPLKTREIRMARERDFHVWDGDNLLFRGKRGYGTTYEVNYYQINAGADSFDRFLRAVMTDSSVTGAWKMTDSSVTGERKITDSSAAGEQAVSDKTGTAAAKRRQQIYEVYAADVELSDKTRQYMEELTAGAQDPLESLRRMEADLASFTYTKQPRELPEGTADGTAFLEYFLLEGREGYCTHFATAFVLMARAQGMPARYVQGFCVPMKGTEEVAVYGDMAHAWPEVYFDGVGWIPFEPTPGYAGIRYTPWATEEGEGSIAVSRDETGAERANDVEIPVAAGAEETAAEETAGTGAWAGIWRILAVLGYAVTAVCVTGSGILVLQRAVGRRRYRQMDVTGKFRMEIAVSLQVLGLLGLRRETGETLQEFRERAVQREVLREPVRKIAAEERERTGSRCDLRSIADYEEILYGEREATPKMLHTAVRERDELLMALREQKRWRYVLFRCRMTVGGQAGMHTG